MYIIPIKRVLNALKLPINAGQKLLNTIVFKPNEGHAYLWPCQFWPFLSFSKLLSLFFGVYFWLKKKSLLDFKLKRLTHLITNRILVIKFPRSQFFTVNTERQRRYFYAKYYGSFILYAINLLNPLMQKMHWNKEACLTTKMHQINF